MIVVHDGVIKCEHRGETFGINSSHATSMIIYVNVILILYDVGKKCFLINHAL